MATLIRIFGDIETAEDAVQEAFAVALRKWPVEGLPPNPGGWIMTTARRCAIDRLRRESRGRDLLEEAAVLSSHTDDPGIPEVVTMHDDRLRLIFTCCNPALSTEAQVALTLRLLGGLTTEEVARAFLVSSPTMEQRLARAKRKIKAARIPYRVPEDDELPGRLRPVLAVVYLVYNAGLTSSAERGSLRRSDSAGATPGDAHARRVGGGGPAGAVAAHRIPSPVENASRWLTRAARRSGSHAMGSRV